MNNSINVKHSAQHPGADRAASAGVRQMRQEFSSSPGMAALVFSAVTVAGLAVSYQVMDSVEESQLLVLWMALWYVAFAALVLFASTLRQVALHLKESLDQWSRNLASKRADERLWAMAKTDPRLMADLQAAIVRQEGASETAAQAPVAWGDRIVKSSPDIARDYTNGYGYV